MGWNFGYDNFNEKTGRVTYAQNLYDATLDRGYDYDQVGRLFPAKFSKTAMALSRLREVEASFSVRIYDG